MVEATFEKLTFQSEWLRKESVTSCINMMDENYKNGLPNYATNSPEEMQNFWEVKRKKELVDLRGKHKDKIEEIAHNCAESTFKIYTILFSNKMRGKSKEEQIKFLKAAPNSTTILDSILIRLSYEAIDDIYSGTGPTNNDEAAKRIVFFNNMCKELYEKSVLLR